MVGEEPPAAAMSAPVHLTAEPTSNAGELSARWSAVPNRKFYEVQIIPVGEAAVSTVWDELPTRPVSTGKSTSKASPPAALSASASAPSEPKVPGPGATPSPPASDPDRQDPARTSY